MLGGIVMGIDFYHETGMQEEEILGTHGFGHWDMAFVKAGSWDGRKGCSSGKTGHCLYTLYVV